MNYEHNYIIGKLKIYQKKGFFEIPEDIRNNRVIRLYLDNQKNQNDLPLIINEEKYTREAICVKLGHGRSYSSNRNLVNALLEYRIIRGKDLKRPFAKINNLSLAQFISYAKKVPIETVILNKTYFKSRKFKKLSVEERIRTLYNAYKGTSWFERFRKKYIRRKKEQQIVDWHLISLRDLPEMLCTSCYEPHSNHGNLVKLINSGFIIPRDGEENNVSGFKHKSRRNFVDNNALACLISHVIGKDKEQVLVKDDYIHSVVDSFIRHRLVPFMKSRMLEIEGCISLESARHRTNSDSEILLKHIRPLRRSRSRFYSKDTKISAMDLAIYQLKMTKEIRFDKERVCEMFGKEFDLKRLGLKVNRSGIYDKHGDIFPLYDMVSRMAKEQLMIEKGPENIIELMFKGEMIFLTDRSIRRYKKMYGLDVFGNKDLTHIKENLDKGYKEDGKIITPHIIFKLQNNTIKGMDLNIS